MTLAHFSNNSAIVKFKEDFWGLFSFTFLFFFDYMYQNFASHLSWKCCCQQESIFIHNDKNVLYLGNFIHTQFQVQQIFRSPLSHVSSPDFYFDS